MASELSPYAIHRIIYFLENDDRLSRRVKKTSAEPTKQHLLKVDQKWNYVYTKYFLDCCLHSPPPPMDYLRSQELAVFLQEDLDTEAMRSVFEHGKPLVFDRDLPPLLVPAIIEAFQQLQDEPSFLEVTLSRPSGSPRVDISALWPQAYITHLPCGACTEADAPGTGNEARLLVEKFHIPSKRFDSQLAVELHFSLDDRHKYARRNPVRPPTAPDLEKNVLRKVVIRLDKHSCGGLPSVMDRTR
ncbi:hypothetical protein AAVH_25876 [Aphelenchoides avenae]|nr:hypothetical protein AAVH_25876 [Aphelenchus avenae]